MSKVVIFGESYGQIEYVLHLVTQNWHDYPITLVIPGLYDLFEFFKVINEKVFHSAINLIYLEPYQPGRARARGINKIPHVFPDIIRERRYLKEIWNKYFAELEGCEVYFLSRGFNGLKVYLVKKLSERNRLVYIYTQSPSRTSKYTPANIFEWAKLAIWRLTYGRDAVMGRTPFIKGFLWMPDKFMEKAVQRVIDIAEVDKITKGFDLSPFRVFDVGSYSVIYFDDGLIGIGYISDDDTFKRELTNIFSIVGKYFPEKEIAVKYHPGYSGSKTLLEVGDILPSFIPAELLYHENVKLYLGIFSRSIAHVDEGLVVSLADLISFKSDEISNKQKEELIQVSKSKILFPKSLDEFERILIDVTGKRA